MWFLLTVAIYHVKLNIISKINADIQSKNVNNIDECWDVFARLQLAPYCLNGSPQRPVLAHLTESPGWPVLANMTRSPSWPALADSTSQSQLNHNLCTHKKSIYCGHQ